MTSKDTNYAKITPELKDSLRDSYVRGETDSSGFRKVSTIEQLAETHNLSVNTLYKLAQRENWKLDRDNFESDLNQKIDSQRAKEFALESKKFDSACINIAKAVLNKIGSKIRDTQDGSNSDFTTQQLDQITGAALKVQKFAKLALGETTDNININADIRQDDSFRRAMEMLDEIEESKRSGGTETTH
jgi:hypothetical protein